jgi:hypothetical protein
MPGEVCDALPVSESHEAGEPCCGACPSGLKAGEVVERGARLLAQGRSLIITFSDSAGAHEHVFDASQPITIGRARTCGVVLASNKVSRVQCTIDFSPAGVELADAGSGCGTFVNGQRVNRAPLHQHDKVFIGDSLLKFELRS